MTTGGKQGTQWRRVGAVLATVAIATALFATPQAASATGPSPIAVPPYGGFNSLLTRAPYVTDLGQTSADVTWATSESTAGTLEWGPLGNCALNQAQVPSRLPTLVPTSGTPPSATGREFTVNTTSEYQSTVALTGLTPSTTYCYRPVSSGGTDLLGPNSSPVFSTLDPVGPSYPLTFDVVGDLGETRQSASAPFPNNLNPDQAAIDSLIGSSGARFVVTAGDVAYNGGSETNYGDLQQTGSDVSDIFGPSYWPQTQGLPTFGAVGNHGQNVNSLRVWPESATAQASSGTYAFDSYPALPADGTKATTSPDAWYAFSTGNTRVYVLDAAWADGNVGTSNLYQVDHDEHWTTSSPEYQWLAADLAAHPGGVKMAVFHFPMRSDNSTQSSDTNLESSPSNPNSLESLLSSNGVKLVFNGHAHTYQRIAPSASGDVVNYVTGGGGGILEPVNSGSACSSFKQSGSIYAIGWSSTTGSGSACGGAPTPTSAAQVFNFLKITVSGSTVTVSPVNAAGQVFDQQSYTYPDPSYPATIIDSAPSAVTSSPTASISFHSSPAGASFTCSLDGAAATPCTSPATYTGLGQGPHTFGVVGTNSSGTDPTPTTASWTVDTTPPSTPADLSGSAASPHRIDLSWSASNDNTGVTGYDILRNGSTIDTVSGTTLSYVDTAVAPSTTYQYAVDARDGAGNVSQATTAVSVTTPAGPTLVQSAGSSTTTVTLPTPSAPGDLLVLTAGLYAGGTQQVKAVSDGENTWSKVGSYDVSGKYCDGEMWYAPNATSVSSVTVTTSASTVALQLQEFSGVASSSPLDGSSGTADTGTSASSGAATPSGSGDLAVGFVAGHNNTQAIDVSSPGYTVPTQTVSAVPKKVTVATGYRDFGAPAPQSFAGTFAGAMYWAAGVALFRPAVVTPPSDFSISANPTSESITAGQPATGSISTAVTSGTAQSVALSDTGAPSGALVSFNPQTLTAGQSSTMTVATSSATPAGTYPITVTGSGPSTTQTTSFTLTVDPVTTSTPALVQSASATETAPATSLGGSFPTTTRAGDLLVLTASEYTGANNHLTSITDSAGDTWTRAGAYDVPGHNSSAELWYAANAAPATAVTAHVASAASIAFQVQEFSGVAATNPLDVSAGTSNTGMSASSGIAPASVSDELVVGFIAGHANAQAITVTSPEYTNQEEVSSTGPVASIQSGYQLGPAPQGQSFSGAFASSMYWAAGVALFEPAAA